MTFKDKILNNKIISYAYQIIFYFELGKGQTQRFYGFIPEIIIILGGLKYLFNINLTNSQMITLILVICTLFIFIGLFVRKSGLWVVDKYVQAEKDPVQNEILSAARKINKVKKWGLDGIG